MVQRLREKHLIAAMRVSEGANIPGVFLDEVQYLRHAFPVQEYHCAPALGSSPLRSFLTSRWGKSFIARSANRRTSGRVSDGKSYHSGTAETGSQSGCGIANGVEKVRVGFASSDSIRYFQIAFDGKALAAHQIKMRVGSVRERALKQFQRCQDLAIAAPVDVAAFFFQDMKHRYTESQCP